MVSKLMIDWNISTIPTLVVLDKSGKIVTVDGVAIVTELGAGAYDKFCELAKQ